MAPFVTAEIRITRRREREGLREQNVPRESVIPITSLSRLRLPSEQRRHKSSVVDKVGGMSEKRDGAALET
jgi:hypothetical protein